MMMTTERNIYTSKFAKAQLREGVVEWTWLATTTNMLPEEFKIEMFNYLHIVLGNKILKSLIDIKDMDFGITPPLQTWTHENIFTKTLAIGADRVAFLTSSDFVTQLSVEQLLDEDLGLQYTVKYFDDKEEAFKWLRFLG